MKTKKDYELNAQIATNELVEFEKKYDSIIKQHIKLLDKVAEANHKIEYENWMEGHCYKITSPGSDSTVYIKVTRSTDALYFGNLVKVLGDGNRYIWSDGACGNHLV